MAKAKNVLLVGTVLMFGTTFTAHAQKAKKDSPFKKRLIVCNSGKTLNSATAKLNRRVNNPQLATPVSKENESEQIGIGAISAPYSVSSPSVVLSPEGGDEAVTVCVTVTAEGK